MSTAPKFIPHYTVDDYRRWEGDWELWDGIAVSMSPSPFGQHQAAARRLVLSITRSIESSACGAELLYEIDWIIRDDMVVRPDVLVLCQGIPDRHVEATPALVAEILSPSTADRDKTFKRDLYEAEGVSVYLIVDPDAQTLDIYQRSAAGDWVIQSVADQIKFSICDDCQIVLQRSKLFGG